jgi:hypothetical protein
MSRVISPVTGKPYGLATVCRIWQLARSGVYRHLSAPAAAQRRGPLGAMSDDHHARRPALPLQQLAQEPFGGPFVPPALHQDVEHDALLVHRAPHPVGEVLAELERPLPYGLVADDDAAGGQHLLDHAQAEREAEIQPNRVADDLGRKAVASVAGEGRRRHPVRLPALLPIRKRPAAKLTVPPTPLQFYDAVRLTEFRCCAPQLDQ